MYSHHTSIDFAQGTSQGTPIDFDQDKAISAISRHSHRLRCSVVPPSCFMLSVRSKLVVLGSSPHTVRQTLMEENPEIRTTALHGLAVV